MSKNITKTLLSLLLLLLPIITSAQQRGFIDIDNGRLWYEERGAGEPLIFIHGHSLDRGIWDEQVSYFADRYRVIVYDARGYGRSSSQSEEIRFVLI